MNLGVPLLIWTSHTFYTPGGVATIPEDYVDEDEEPLAEWEALLLPNWRWEALTKEDDGLYYGRVKSPRTYDQWEYGHFTQEQLEEAGAYRVDDNLDSNEPVFPDGGYQLADLYETKLIALEDEFGEGSI